MVVIIIIMINKILSNQNIYIQLNNVNLQI